MKIFKAISAAALLFLALMVFAPGRVDAAVQDLNGWAWSSNIGWISFNCLTGGTCATSDYKVRLDDQTGVVSGYAWSSNVGWISFNPADISGCAPNATQPNINTQTGFAVGWARVLVPMTTSDPYWNGCIALSGKEFTSPDVSGNRGVTYDVTDKKIKGHAWGSNVIGWIKFLDVICAGCTNLPPASTDFTVQANSATLSNVPGSTVATPVSVTRLGLNDVGVSNITLSGLPANVTASWTKNGAAVAGNRTCTSTLPGTPSPCTFSLTLTSGATAPAVGTYSVIATAVSTSDPAFSRSEDFVLVIKGVPTPGERDYSVSVGDVTMVKTAGVKASTQVILTRTGSVDIGIANVTIESGLPTGINVVPRWYQNGTQVDPRACGSTSVGACQFLLEFTAEPGDATVGNYNLQLKSTSTGSPVIIKYTEMSLTIQPGTCVVNCGGSTSDFGVNTTDQISMDKAAGSIISTVVTATRIGTNDVGVSNLVVTGLPQNVTASWRYPDGSQVTGQRSCASTVLNACRFILRLTATSAIAPGVSGTFPSTFPLVITGTSATTPSFNRTKNVSLVVTDPSVNPTTPTVTLKVNDKFTASSPNNVVVIGSKNNKVQWDKGGVGAFDKCVISSNPTNPLWTGQEFDSSYDSYVQTGVTISQRTTFSVTCLQGNNPYASSVTVDVTASPDFREF